MPLTVEPQGEVTVYRVEGRLDNALSTELKTALIQLLGDRRPSTGEGRGPRLVLDLAAVDFINSFGIAVLTAAVKRARASGGEVYFAALQPYIRELFHMVRLTQVFALYATRDEALTAARA